MGQNSENDVWIITQEPFMGDSTANILTPGVKKSQVCNGILRAIAPTVLQAAKLIPMLPLDSHGRISVGLLFNSWPKT